MGRFTGILGLLTMLGLAYAFSTDRKAIRKKTVGWGLGLQILFAIFVLKVEIGRQMFEVAGNGVKKLRWILVAMVACSVPAMAFAQGDRSHNRVLAAFRDVVSEASKSTP